MMRPPTERRERERSGETAHHSWKEGREREKTPPFSRCVCLQSTKTPRVAAVVVVDVDSVAVVFLPCCWRLYTTRCRPLKRERETGGGAAPRLSLSPVDIEYLFDDV